MYKPVKNACTSYSQTKTENSKIKCDNLVVGFLKIQLQNQQTNGIKFQEWEHRTSLSLLFAFFFPPKIYTHGKFFQVSFMQQLNKKKNK